jgi:UDP-glucose 4-epimerase
MKVLITGAKGFVGSQVVAECKRKGIETLEFDLPECNICSSSISELIPEGLDAIIHLAALSKDTDCKGRAYECFQSNVMGTLNLINAAELKKAKQFIFASSEWVYDNCTQFEEKNEESVINIANHTSEYALSKLVSEANLRQKFQGGFCATAILRFGIIYGPRKSGWSAVESLFDSVKNKEEISIGSLGTGRHFIFVTDIANGILKSIGLSGFNILNLEGESLITLRDIIETSKEILGKNPKIIEKDSANSSVRRVSNKKAKEILNWEPKISLKEGLRLLEH